MSLSIRRPGVMLSLLVAGLLAVTGLTGSQPAAAGSLVASSDLSVAQLPLDADGNAKVIVAFDNGAIPAGTLDTMTTLGVVRGIELPSIGAVAVTAPTTVVEAVAQLPGVSAVEPQRQVVSHLYASKQQINAIGLDQPAPYNGNDTGHHRGATRPGVTGNGVTVAVLDSGVFAPHPDFGDRVVKGLNYSYSLVQATGGISAEDWDLYAESTGAAALQDEIGHGTHVAGTVGGDGSLSDSNGGPDLAGVAPDTEFISMRVATPGFGIVEDLDWEEAALAAFDWIIRNGDAHGVDIAQNSWGLLPAEPDCLGLHCGVPTDFDAMSAMIASVVDSGVSVIFSAGNDGPEPGTIGGYHNPDNGAILVGAACKSVDSSRCSGDQVVTGFSSRGNADGSGPQVDVMAPGDTIMAAASPSILVPLTECADIQEPGYLCISGTSMASPHVSGVAALMYEANPDISPARVKECLMSTAVDMLEAGFDIHTGQGMVDAEAAVICAHKPAPREK